MKRSRIICCGVTQEFDHRLSSSRTVTGTSRTSDCGATAHHHIQRSSPLDNHITTPGMSRHHTGRQENCGAHNKYDARPLSRQLPDSGVDISDLTVTLPGMVVGGCPSPLHRSTVNNDCASMHASPLKQISKREKARQKLSNSLKRAKVLLTDRAAQQTPPQSASPANHGNHANSALCVQSNSPSSTPQPQSICHPNTCLGVEQFKVIKLKAAIDRKPTSIDEKSTAVLKYRTPHFR